MNRNSRCMPHQLPLLAALLLAAPLAIVGPARPVHAQARAAAPAVEALQLDADGGLDPGSELRFQLRGSPGGRASVRINNSGLVVPLAQARPGLYTGSYVVRRTDRIDAGGVLQASIERGNQRSTRNFSFPPEMVAQAQERRQQYQAQAPRIQDFNIATEGVLEPGAEVRFVVQGAPGAQVSAQVPGVANQLPLRETRPGVYRGSYTVRRQDDLRAFAQSTATLRLGNEVLTARLPQQAAASLQSRSSVMGSAPAANVPLQITSHGANASIEGGVADIRGITAPGGTVRVHVDAIPPAQGQRLEVARQLVDQTVQADAQGNFSIRFDTRGMAPGTRYDVNVSAGNGGNSAQARLVLTQRG